MEESAQRVLLPVNRMQNQHPLSKSHLFCTAMISIMYGLLASILRLLLFMVPIIRGVPAAASNTDPTDYNTLLKPGTHAMSIHVDNYERRFIFFTPKSFKPGGTLPLSILLSRRRWAGRRSGENLWMGRKGRGGTFFCCVSRKPPQAAG